MLAIFFLGFLLVIGLGVGAALWWSKFWGYGKVGTTICVLGVLFVLYAIPFGDHTIGEIRKNELCKEFGGIQINRVVENVDGFMWGPVRESPPYQTFGYSFYESDTKEGGIFRYTRRADGVVFEEKVGSSLAQYLVRGLPVEKLGDHHTIRKFEIVDRHTNEILASHGTVAYKGGWLGVFGTEACPSRFDRVKFIHSVLKPGKTKE